MEEGSYRYDGPENRAEPRSVDRRYSSVEFSIRDLNYLYQFRIWDTSSAGMSILIKEDSEILEHLKVGDILDMKFYPEQISFDPENIKTEIRHITKDVSGRTRGHCLVGLSLRRNQKA